MLEKFLRQNRKRKDKSDNRKKCHIIFYRKKCRKRYDLQVVKVSLKKAETTDNKIHNVFFFSRIGRKRKTKVNTIDFINIRDGQSFLKNSINPIETKIENDTVKNHD